MIKLDKGNKWMLVYSILFLLFSIIAIANDFSNEYALSYIIWGIFSTLLFNLGNFLFSFGIKTNRLQSAWKIIFPVMIINIIVSIIVDELYGGNSSSEDGVVLYIFFVVILIAIFFPAIRANYKIGYVNKNKL